MSDELKRRLVGVVVLLAVFSLIAWWIGARDDRNQDIPSADAEVRNYDVRELDRIAAAQQAEQAVAEPVGEAAQPAEDAPIAEQAEESADAEPATATAAVTDARSDEDPEPAPARPETAAPEQAAKAPEPAPKPVETKPAPAKPATDAKGQWIVQVASVTQQANAQQLAERLKKKGWQSFVEQGVVSGTTYYRVRVGPYAERGIAERAAADLQKELGQAVAVMSR